MAGAGAQHEVIYGELTAAFKQVRERHRPIRALERIGPVEANPGQSSPRRAQVVQLVGERPFLRQQVLTGREPFVARNDFVLHDQSPSMGVAVSARGTGRRTHAGQPGRQMEELMSRYIQTMPPAANDPGSGPQIAVGAPPAATSDAIAANVGAAARRSQAAMRPDLQ